MEDSLIRNCICHGLWQFLFLQISFFSKNVGFRVKMYGTSKIDLFIRYNLCRKYFFPRSIFIDIKWKKLSKTFFFLVFTLKIKFAGFFIIIFIFSALKYVDIVSFKLIGSKCFSELYPWLIMIIQKLFPNYSLIILRN